MTHLSVLCLLMQDAPHVPCSGTCDGHGTGAPCLLACQCGCHLAQAEDAADATFAFPGDPALDCHLTGLRLTCVTSLDGAEYDAEVILSWDVSGAAGWWTDAVTGRRVTLTAVRWMETIFGLKMRPGHKDIATELVARLAAWAASGAAIEMTAAPGKWTVLSSPGHPAGSIAAYPRGMGTRSQR